MSKELKTLVPSVVLKFVDGLLKRYEGKTDYNIYITKDWLLEIKQCLDRLESIDNSSPSEALEFLDKMTNYILLDEEYGFIDNEEKKAIIEDSNTIKQALLKAQEPKQYLKWEDLEFDKNKEIDVLMNGNKYVLELRPKDTRMEYLDEVILYNIEKYGVIALNEIEAETFNDLRLERVKE